MAHYVDAEAALKWGMALQEKAFGQDNLQIAQTLDQLTALYSDWGRWQDAEYYGKRAVSILQKDETNPADSLPQVLDHLGTVEMEMGDAIEAQELLQKSLKLQEKGPNIDPQLIIPTLEHLSRVYESTKHFSDAQNCLQKILDISKKNYPADSVQQADAMELLGNFYRSQKQNEKAESLFLSALPIYQRFVGVYFGYSTLDYVRKLAKAYESLGKNKEAEVLLQKSQPTLKSVFGPSHPRVALGLLDLAQVEEALDQKSLAQEDLKEALVIAQSFFADTHPLVVKIQKQLHS